MAKQLCLTGEIISAEEALRIGLVNRVYPQDSFMDEVMKMAQTIASKGRASVRAVKHLVDRGAQIELKSALLLETESFGTLRSSVDAQEGLEAFTEKRKPNFTGTLVK
jgi:enoyl-CoA hydratase